MSRCSTCYIKAFKDPEMLTLNHYISIVKKFQEV